MFLLVPAYPGCPGQTAVKWLLLLLYCTFTYLFIYLYIYLFMYVGHLNEIGTNSKYRGPVMAITQPITSVSGKDRLVYIRLAFFVRIKCLRFSRNACVFLDFIILGKVQSPLTRPTPSFFKIKFHFKNMKFYSVSQRIRRRHKNKH